MPKHRSHSIDFERQVIAEHHAGVTLHAVGRRHDLSRNLIRIWIEKTEAGALDRDWRGQADERVPGADRGAQAAGRPQA